MKIFAALATAVTSPLGGGNLRALLRMIIILLATIAVFSVGFQVLMALEGRDFSWAASVYWTVVTMSTLGFGDIVFSSDLGRMYSVLVLFSGALLILVLLPFTFIQLVYVPWRDAVREASAPRSVPHDMRGHIILTGRDPMERSLMHRARAAGVDCVLLVEDLDEAVALKDANQRIMVGDLDDPQTYRAARLEHAALLLAAGSDQGNSNIVFTAREATDRSIIVATAGSPDSVDILQLAGADHVLQLGRSLGDAFARRILSPGARCSPISSFEDLVIAEASAAGTPLVGRSLAQLDLRDRFGVSVVGVWDRGSLQVSQPGLVIEESSILLLAGHQSALDAYDEAHAPSGRRQPALDGAPVVIIGGGRVGRATAEALRAEGISYRIVERLPERVWMFPEAVIGDAADLEVLREAGIEQAPAVVVTTHDDDMNVYLTLYCRKLRPDTEILGRVRHDRNISTMHRAGADFVLSYASTGAIDAWNAMRDDSTLLLAEGLIVFRVPMPPSLVGVTLASAQIPASTGCSVIGIIGQGACQTDLGPDTVLPADAQLILIGDDQAEDRFYQRYMAEGRPSARLRFWRRTRG